RLRQVADAGLVDRLLLLADDPRGPLRPLVHRAVDGDRRVGQCVVVVAADHAVLVDRQLEDVVGVLLLALHDGENAERLPLLLLGGLRLLPGGGDVRRLRGVLLRRGDRLAVVVDAVVLVDDGRAVVVDHGLRGGAAEGGNGGVRRPPPGGRRRRARRRAPRGRVGRVPAGVEIVVAGEARADVTRLGADRRRAAVGGVVARGTADGDAARHGPVRGVRVGRGAPVRA